MKIKELTFKQAYDEGKNLLKQNGIECYKSDTMWLFFECFGLDRKDLLLRGNEPANSNDCLRFFNMLEERIQGIPVQYIIGHCDFMGICFDVGNGVLIPRDDTEVLVRETVKRIKTEISRVKRKINVLDLCSGSGVVAIVVKKIFGDAVNVLALELYDSAFFYLKKNIDKNNLEIRAIQGDIFKFYNEIENGFADCIVSNPPYIPSSDIEYLDDTVKKEPITALNGGNDGLEFYNVICKKWLDKISPSGFISLEIGINQSEHVVKILKQCSFKNYKIYNDINSVSRVIISDRGNSYS